jgi:hypothetical protein
MNALKARILRLEAQATPRAPAINTVWKWDGAPIPYQDIRLNAWCVYRYQHPSDPTPMPPGPVKLYLGDPTCL